MHDMRYHADSSEAAVKLLAVSPPANQPVVFWLRSDDGELASLLHSRVRVVVLRSPSLCDVTITRHF